MDLSNKPSCDSGSSSLCHNPCRFLLTEVLKLYFLVPEPCVEQSVLLPSCSSQFSAGKCGIFQFTSCHLDHPIHQLPTCYRLATCPLRLGCPSPPLLPVWINVSSLTPWLSNFYIVQFSGGSVYFLFLNWMFFFWPCKEAKCVYFCLHLGQKGYNENFNQLIALVSLKQAVQFGKRNIHDIFKSFIEIIMCCLPH